MENVGLKALVDNKITNKIWLKKVEIFYIYKKILLRNPKVKAYVDKKITYILISSKNLENPSIKIYKKTLKNLK